MGTRLYVGNLSYETTSVELEDLFKETGEVANCDVVMDRFSGRSKGFAFVEMGSQEDANRAIEELNGKDFQGRELTVNEARPRAERPAQPSFGGGGGYGGAGGGGGGGYGGGAKRPGKPKGSRRNARNEKRNRKSFF
jgi:RNA recognition motif-containing protein